MKLKLFLKRLFLFSSLLPLSARGGEAREEISAGVYGNEHVEFFREEDVTYLLTGDGTVSYEGVFTLDRYFQPPINGDRQGVFGAESVHFTSEDKTSLNFYCTGFDPEALKNPTACRSFVYVQERQNAQVAFQNLGDLTFRSDDLNMMGITSGKNAGDYIRIVSFEDVGNISFQGLSSGGIYIMSSNHVSFTNTGDISFTDMNGSNDYKGAIFINQGETFSGATGKGDIFFDTTGNITFKNLRKTSSYIAAAGIYTGEGSVSFNNTGDILFENNEALQGAGGINVYDMYGRGGMLSFTNINGSIVFRNNAGKSTSSPAVVKGVGAILARGSFLLLNAGEVLFEGNTTDVVSAGAIYGDLRDGNSRSFTMSADRGNITFIGNAILDQQDVWLRAVRLDCAASNEINFRAQTGREITFYDGIDINGGGTGLLSGSPTLYINRIPNQEEREKYYAEGGHFGGSIRFTGIKTEEILKERLGNGDSVSLKEMVEKSRKVDVDAHVSVEGGTLAIEYGMVLDNSSSRTLKPSFTLKSGILEMTSGAALNSNKVVVSGRDAGSILRIGGTPVSAPEGIFERPSLKVSTFDISRGFNWDLMPFLATGDSGMEIQVGSSFKLGGTIGIMDTLDGYADKYWSEQREFSLFSFDGDTWKRKDGDPESLVSNTTGTSEIDSEYTYKGIWNYEWQDTDSDGTPDELVAVWSPREGEDPVDPIDPVDPVDPVDPAKPSKAFPDRRGELALNSLWSSASNIAALGNTALGQLSDIRLSNKLSSRIWAMGLGDFARRHSRSGVDGYDYDGGGYSVGMDSDFGSDKGVWGIAFGQIYGHSRSRDYQSKTDQRTMMGTLYWGKLFPVDEKTWWTAKADVSWGFTDNCMKSVFTGGLNAHGDWNNRTWLVQTEISRSSVLSGQWIISPFVRLELTRGKEDGFSEDGSYARCFGSARLQRFTIPVGVSVSKAVTCYDKPWHHTLRLSYAGDVVRDIPEAGVYSFYSDFSWTARAVKPSRHAMRVEYDTLLQWNERWNLYAGYGLELRDRSTLHQVHAGVSWAF